MAFHTRSSGLFGALLDAGADPGRPDRHGSSVVHHAAEEERVWWLETLLEHGADPDVAHGRTGYRPLMTAVLSHHDQNIHLLLRAGADVNATDNQQSTLLHIASRTKLARYSLLFLEAGADPLARDSLGKTFQAYQWMGKEQLLLDDVQRDRERIRQWLRTHGIAVEG